MMNVENSFLHQHRLLPLSRGGITGMGLSRPVFDHCRQANHANLTSNYSTLMLNLGLSGPTANPQDTTQLGLVMGWCMEH